MKEESPFVMISYVAVSNEGVPIRYNAVMVASRDGETPVDIMEAVTKINIKHQLVAVVLNIIYMTKEQYDNRMETMAGLSDGLAVSEGVS